jgi:hypothetical protein
MPDEDEHYEETRGILFRGAVGTALDFKTRAVDWIMACRIQDGGIPAFRCYDAETEVLTNDGWKHFNEVTFGDEIATLNPFTKELEYQKPLNIINVLYKGKMYHVADGQVDLLVTPTHNMYVAFYRSKRVNGKKVILPRSEWEFRLVPAEQCFGKHCLYLKNAVWNGKNQDYFELPLTQGSDGRVLEQSHRIPMDEWLAFFGLWLAEGYTTLVKKEGNGYNYIIGISNSDRNLLNEMQKLCESWGIHSHIRPHGESCFQLRIYNKQLYDYLSRLGESFQKHIPKEIKSLSAKHLKVLLDYYLKGDGHYVGNSATCTTSSVKLRDDLQEIALKMGMSANYVLDREVGTEHLMKAENRIITTKHNSWRLFFISKQNVHRIYATRAKKESKKFVEEWIDYDAIVGCVEVPNHIIYVRRNGKPVWCGNTGFAKRPFKADSDYYVMGVCWLGSNLVGSQWFSGVPKEDWQYMHENSDDYVWLLKRYGSKEQVEKAVKAPVVVV